MDDDDAAGGTRAHHCAAPNEGSARDVCVQRPAPDACEDADVLVSRLSRDARQLALLRDRAALAPQRARLCEALQLIAIAVSRVPDPAVGAARAAIALQLRSES